MYSIEPYDEQKLLKLIVAGDHNAFTYLFEREYKKLYSFALKLTRSKELSEEIVQDIFLKIWVNRGSLESINNLGGYLNRVVRNHTFNVLHRIAQEKIITDEIAKRETELDDDTEAGINFRGTSKLLNEAIATLTPQQQRVYDLCHGQGLKYAEAAKLLNISPGTVHTHMKFALQTIRKYLNR